MLVSKDGPAVFQVHNGQPFIINQPSLAEPRISKQPRAQATE
jgi:hypothetical protein